jgi:hypothetical protein
LIQSFIDGAFPMKIPQRTNRRSFLSGMAAASPVVLMPEIAGAATDTGISILGPRPGYTPQVGTLVSMLTWMQPAVTGPVKGLTQAQLDYLFECECELDWGAAAASGGDGAVLSTAYVRRDEVG